jgi:hypothetical protein
MITRTWIARKGIKVEGFQVQASQQYLSSNMEKSINISLFL